MKVFLKDITVLKLFNYILQNFDCKSFYVSIQEIEEIEEDFKIVNVNFITSNKRLLNYKKGYKTVCLSLPEVNKIKHNRLNFYRYFLRELLRNFLTLSK